MAEIDRVRETVRSLALRCWVPVVETAVLVRLWERGMSGAGPVHTKGPILVDGA
ncbi:hypothetical protein ACFWTE_05560 [Nocardiopsis sp. NPDC058631]|uniref:hypothetical protein n=1 Tax=Nocardiopsis sp. NPDC058631 TaxID=3346566 RepID=UPI003663A610